MSNSSLLLAGISRSTLPAGTKGFAGTEGFMAPEIMRYNGEEEYTEKVGMEGGKSEKTKYFLLDGAAYLSILIL